MIQSANDYDFTTVSTPGCVSGVGFADAMCPRLEQVLWLNEAVKTAERRGGFNPLTGTFPAAGAKNDPAVMVPDARFLADFQSRVNAVLTVAYHDRGRLPAGVVNSLSGSWTLGTAVSDIPIAAWSSTSGVSSAVSSALVTPQAVAFSTRRMWPSRDNFGEYSTAVSRAVSDLGLRRSAVYVRSYGGLNGYIYSSARTTYRNGAPGNSPMQDWKAGLGVPNPFLNETGNDYIYDTDHTLVDYYRVKSDEHDIEYSLEASSWEFPIGLPPWTHGVDFFSQTSVHIVPVWRVIAAPLWREIVSGSAGQLVRDRTVSYYAWIGSQGGVWGSVQSWRNINGQYFSIPVSQPTELVRGFGATALAGAVNPNALPSSGMVGGGSGTRVGYVAHVFCIGAIYVATLIAPRNIGS